MTMRTYRHFICKKGHREIETKSENDRPYSKGLGEHGRRRHAGARHGQERGRCLRLRLLRQPDDIG